MTFLHHDLSTEAKIEILTVILLFQCACAVASAVLFSDIRDRSILNPNHTAHFFEYQQFLSRVLDFETLYNWCKFISFRIKSIKSLYFSGPSSLGVPGVPWHTQYFADQLTLFQPGGTDYAHLITTDTPGFSDLPTALYINDFPIPNLK